MYNSLPHVGMYMEADSDWEVVSTYRGYTIWKLPSGGYRCDATCWELDSAWSCVAAIDEELSP